MKVAIIGRTETLYNTTLQLLEEGHAVELIITSKAAPEYKKNESDFENLARKIGCDYFFENKLDRKSIIEKVNKKGLDIGISTNFPNIIGAQFIKLFKHGILNSHSGDLPRYRGNACPNWAIINGEESIVLTIHYMEAGVLDSGDIVAQSKLPINQSTYIGEVVDWIYKETPILFAEALRNIEEDPLYFLKKQSQDPAVALRCYPRLPEDSQIDWNLPRQHIHRLIRASSEPFQGAFSYYNGKKLIIWRAELFDDKEQYLAIPGQVSEINKETGEVIVICGDGKLKLTHVSFEDNQRVKPSMVIKSIRKRLVNPSF